MGENLVLTEVTESFAINREFLLHSQARTTFTVKIIGEYSLVRHRKQCFEKAKQ